MNIIGPIRGEHFVYIYPKMPSNAKLHNIYSYTVYIFKCNCSLKWHQTQYKTKAIFHCQKKKNPNKQLIQSQESRAMILTFQQAPFQLQRVLNNTLTCGSGERTRCQETVLWYCITHYLIRRDANETQVGKIS